jgi:hypothetical protein
MDTPEIGVSYIFIRTLPNLDASPTPGRRAPRVKVRGRRRSIRLAAPFPG